MISYKGYSIDPFEREPGRWRTTIKRLDGRKIKAVGSSTPFPSVTTSADCLSEQAAIDLARKGIDGGGMSLGS
jgi:hypothetical protein